MVGEGVYEAKGQLDGLQGGICSVEDFGEQSGGETVGKRYEQLPLAGGTGGGELDGEVRKGGDAHGIEGLGLDVCEWFKDRWIGLCGNLCIFVVIGYLPGARCVGVAMDKGCVRIVRLGASCFDFPR